MVVYSLPGWLASDSVRYIRLRRPLLSVSRAIEITWIARGRPANYLCVHLASYDQASSYHVAYYDVVVRVGRE